MKKILQSYLRDEISKSEFSDAICNITELENVVGRTRFLHLKYGDKVTALECFQKENNCTICGTLHTDDLAHSSQVRKTLDNLLGSAKLERVQKPLWYTPHFANKNPYGAQGFFKCIECGSIIDVCEPERMYRGSCEVVG